jgi:hypothetical protein
MRFGHELAHGHRCFGNKHKAPDAESLLFIACGAGHETFARILLENGAPASEQELHEAIYFERLPVACVLLE